jgi:poly(hydroxyalkanoate) depolymerase family esterase
VAAQRYLAAMQRGSLMSDFRKAMTRLQEFRRKFEGLLERARDKAVFPLSASAETANRLRELTAFGSNPGNLRMLVYEPERLPRNSPLVVALHGCSQSAAEYDRGSGWSQLADRLGFAIVYPEQQPTNNPNNCFSWFLPDDTTRDQGEALSIRQMVEHAVAALGVDRRRVFVTGLSAGGAMASVMLATYPEVFAGGAIIAGLPYGCARTVQQAFEAMFNEQSIAAPALGDRVRAASNHRGSWPKISVWHGTADPIVKPANSEEIIRQWFDLHGLAASPTYAEAIDGHTRRVWNDADGQTVIEAFSIGGMAHGVPLATSGEGAYGAVGAFFLDAGISSTHHIANFWHLSEGLAATPRAAAAVAAPAPIWSDAPTVAAGVALLSASDSETSSFAADADTTRQLDPNHVIAKAFRAAGLPVPEFANMPPGSASPVDTGAIIKAALKAAGFRRS